MNERLQQLAREAGHFEFNKWDHFDIDKFAELIVRECSDVAKQTEPDDGDDYKSGRSWAGIEILKHFNVGIEE